MPTSADIIGRLPPADVLTVPDIAIALGMRTTMPVLRAIDRGELSAIRISERTYRISRREAVRWIAAMESAR